MRPFKDCLRGLLGTLRPLRWRVLLSAFLGLVQVALSLSFVWYSKKVVDLATGEQLPDEVLSALTDPAVLKTAFNAQKDQPGGLKTMKKYLWSLELDAWDQAHPQG